MRTVHSREAYDSLKEHVGDKLLDTIVRQSIAYAESAERAVSILEHRPDLGADYCAWPTSCWAGAWGSTSREARSGACDGAGLQTAARPSELAHVARPGTRRARA